MIVVITDEADADLERVGDFIAQDNPRRAITFVNELIDRCHRLADTPRGFPLVPRYEHTGVRRRRHPGGGDRQAPWDRSHGFLRLFSAGTGAQPG